MVVVEGLEVFFFLLQMCTTLLEKEPICSWRKLDLWFLLKGEKSIYGLGSKILVQVMRRDGEGRRGRRGRVR